MDFSIETGRLEVDFTQAEIISLVEAGDNPVAFLQAVDEIVEANQLAVDSCRPALFNRLPYEALGAVRRSPQVESSALNADQTYALGATIGLAMFGPRPGRGHESIIDSVVQV